MSIQSQSLSDQEFIEFCYQQILQRNPDQEGQTHYNNALNSHHLTREELILQFITSEEFKTRLTHQKAEFVPAGHFYSAIPSVEEREAFLSTRSSDENIWGINLNLQKQMNLLEQFKKYHDQCSFPEHKTEPFRYYFSNPAYSYTDALTLYSMIREFQPQRIIEIGSGFSSAVMLDTSDNFLKHEIQLTFIEPYPELLYSLFKPNDQKHPVIAQKVQDIDNNIFSCLEANDILFVDSTHVAKLNSDVNKILFEILPSLQKGVLIHFHDIFWPFEYPKEWIREGRAWNEVYILRAFLEFNESFEILFFSDYLHQHQHQWLAENMPLYLKNPGGNIWLRKIKD